MAVEAIRFFNFMAFRDTGWIELQPITLIFGRNSSGKSAIVRGLRLLKQSLTEAPPGSPFAFSVADGVDLGSFAEMIHGQKLSDEDGRPRLVKLGFRFRIDPGYLQDLMPTDPGWRIPWEYSWAELVLGYRWSESESNAQLHYLRIQCHPFLLHGVTEPRPDAAQPPTVDTGSVTEDEAGLSVSLDTEWPLDDESAGRREILFEAEHVRWKDLPVELKPAIPDFGETWQIGGRLAMPKDPKDPEEEAAYQRWAAMGIGSGFMPPLLLFGNSAATRTINEGSQANMPHGGLDIVQLWNDARMQIHGFLERIEHVPPIRPEPRRLYMLDDTEQRAWRRRGFGAWLKLLKGDLEPAQRAAIRHWMVRLELGLDLDREPAQLKHERSAVVVEILVDEGPGGIRAVNLADVGSGATQVLPVIVQTALADPESLVIVEQPELHLRPRAQAKLGNLFVETVCWPKNRKEDGVRLVLESHSEHLILRLQGLIRSKRLSHSDLNVIYVVRSGSESECHILRLDNEGGFIDEWPQGFFEERYREIFNLREPDAPEETDAG